MGLLLFKYCCTVFVCWVLSPIICRGCPHPRGCPANEPKTVYKKLQFIHSFGQWKGFPNHRHRRDQTLDNITKIYTLHAVNDSNHDEKPKLQWKLLFFCWGTLQISAVRLHYRPAHRLSCWNPVFVSTLIFGQLVFSNVLSSHCWTWHGVWHGVWA